MNWLLFHVGLTLVAVAVWLSIAGNPLDPYIGNPFIAASAIIGQVVMMLLGMVLWFIWFNNKEKLKGE